MAAPARRFNKKSTAPKPLPPAPATQPSMIDIPAKGMALFRVLQDAQREFTAWCAGARDMLGLDETWNVAVFDDGLKFVKAAPEAPEQSAPESADASKPEGAEAA